MTVTLRDIERELAPRVGIYRRFQAVSGTTTTVVVAALKSTIDQGGWENMFLLRRGTSSAVPPESAIVGFSADDRQRMVKTYTPATGELTVDQPWATAPIANEYFELHSLDPTYELRFAVQKGLERCFFVDRYPLTLTSLANERQLTGAVSNPLTWLTAEDQIFELDHGLVGNTYIAPRVVHWFKAFTRAGDIWISTYPDPFPDTLHVIHRRAVSSFVNGADSTTGPTTDLDTLNVSVNYAAAAGLMECWRRFRDRLSPLVGVGMIASQAEAAADFTRQAHKHYRPPQRRQLLSRPFGLFL